MSTRRLPFLAAALASGLCASGCGGDETSAGPGAAASSSSSGGGFVPDAPAEPAPPAPPVLTCPSGWRSIATDPPTCDPWPTDKPPACPDGQALFPGESACAPIGAACPAGDWPEGLPASGVTYVRPDAEAGGDGSVDNPFTTVAEALTVAEAGSVIALSKGVHQGVFGPEIPITLRGACAGGTTLEQSDPDSDSATVLINNDVALSDLTIRGDSLGIVVGGGQLTLEGVEIADVTSIGLRVAVGVVSGSRVVVRRTASDGSGHFGNGIYAEYGAQVTLEQVLVEDSHDFGMVVWDASTVVDLQDAAVRATGPSPASGNGDGICLFGGEVKLRRAVVEDNEDAGIYAQETSHVDLEDVVVRRTRFRSSDKHAGEGIWIERGAELDGRRVFVDDSYLAGVAAFDQGSRLRIEDLVVRKVGTSGFNPIGPAARGLRGALVEIERATFSETLVAGATFADQGTIVRLTDVLIRDMVPADQQAVGVAAVRNSHGELTRVRIEGAQMSALFLGDIEAVPDSTTVVVNDVDIAQLLDTNFIGYALAVAAGSRVEGARLRVRGANTFGAYVAMPGSALVLEDASFLDTRATPCTDAVCDPGGVGVSADNAATVQLTRFLISRNVLAGAQVARGATMVLRNGEVSENEIGVNIAVEGFDPVNVTEQVLFRDNGRNLDSAALPLTVPTISLGDD